MRPSIRLKLLLDRQPGLYLALLRLQRRNHWSRDWVVHPQTEIVIEGFPRSGNSFALSAFKQSNPNVSQIATHVHMPAQIIKAADYEIPTIVLLREPIAAVCSMLALSTQIGDRHELSQKKTIADAKRLLHVYSVFYRRVYTVRTSLQFAPFEHVTEDFGQIQDAINARFKTNFTRFEHTAKTVEAIFKAAPIHLGPREDRDKLKGKIMTAANSPELELHRQRALEIYHSCLKHAQKQ